MIGRHIGPYRIESVLGRGGMGEVYRAWDDRLNRAVALKLLPKSAVTKGTAVDRFLREARAASALNHPNIVTVHDAGEVEADGHFIVQELVRGATLRQLMERGLEMTAAVDIARQVAKALTAAHEAGIVHRDIKPENIMVRPDGYVKVLDFGLARLLLANTVGEEEGPTLTNFDTAPGIVMGTTPYMSPEQAQAAPTGPPSDVFSFGSVMYEMVTGRRPFVGPSSFSVIAAILAEHPVPPARLNPSTPPALDALVLRMLAKEAARRPTAIDVENELALLSGQSAIDLAPPTTAVRRTTVGREEERAELRQVFARVAAGQSLVLAVTGEAGIGKTSLVEDFLAEIEVSRHHPVIARGRCSERLAGSEAYLPLLEVLDSLLHRTRGETFSELMKTCAPTWFLQVATLSPDGTTMQRLQADLRTASQERMKREMGALLQDISRAAPLVIFLDDLHWADVSTIDLLNYLAGRFEGMRVLILGTYRRSEVTTTEHPLLQMKATLEGRGLFREFPLEFLERADVERYLSLEFPEHRFPPEFASLVHTKTEGSPLFMADLLRYLRDRRVLSEDGGRWIVTRPLDEIERELPESVRSMIARKIERLSETDRKLVVAASVQGHEFDSAVVSEALGIDPGDVEESLEALDRVHVFVRTIGEQEFPDRALTMRYRFVHVLYQNVLYASLQPTRRASLSGKVAAALARHHGTASPAVAAQLALLYEAARDFQNAAAQFHVAAQHAAQLFGFREAASLAKRGLKALDGLPEDPGRLSKELGLQLILGLSLRSFLGWAAPEVEKVYSRARELCGKLGDPPELFPVLWGLTLVHAIRGDLRMFRTLSEQLLVQANQTGRVEFLLAGHQMMASVCEFLGQPVQSSEHFEKAIALHDLSQHEYYSANFGLDPGMIARALSMRPLWYLGYADQSIARTREALSLARAAKQPTTLSFALIIAENILMLRGEAEEAVALGDEGIALCREYSLAQEMEWTRCYQGLALALLGRTEEGVAQLKDSLASMERINARLQRGTYLGLLAEALLLSGRYDEGLRAVDEGLTVSQEALERCDLAELHRVRGELLNRLERTEEAEQSYNLALDVAREQGARAFELRAATGLARLMNNHGRTAEARELLAPVYEALTEGRDTRDLIQAAELLRQLG